MAHQNSIHHVKAILISDVRSPLRMAWSISLAWLISALVIATLCQLASAQDQRYSSLEMSEKYRVELAPFDADDDQLKDIKSANRGAERTQRESLSKVKDIVNNNGNISDPIIADYFEGYAFPAMTTVDNRVLSNLGSTRTRFIKDFLGSDVTGTTRAGMIDLTIRAMDSIRSNDTLHPSARLNAVYLLGMLDDTAAVRVPVRLPVPSKAAYTSLNQILDSNDDKSSPAYLKVAALAGIQRHVEIDRLVGGGQLSAAEKQALLAKAGAFLDDPKDDDLTYWLKRRGMQLIGLIGDPQSVDRVLAVLNSDDAAFWLKFDALEAIGQLNLTDGSPKNMEAAVAATQFVATSLENESKSIEAALDKLVYDQILYQDVDLKQTGTNYEANLPAETGTAFGGGGPGSGMGGPDMGRGGGSGGPPGGGKFGGGGMGAGGPGAGGPGAGGPGAGGPGGQGPDMGRGGGGFGGFGGFGGGFGGGGTTASPTLELPGYQLIVFRRKIKSLAYTGAQVLGGETGTDGLNKIVDADGQAFIAKVLSDLNATLRKSNVGIIDLDDKKSDDVMMEDKPVSVTQQLIDLCAKSGKTLAGYVRTQKGEPEANPLDPADASAAAGETPAAAAPAATTPDASTPDATTPDDGN